MKKLALALAFFAATSTTAHAIPTEREYKPCCRSTPKWYAGFDTSVGLLSDVNFSPTWSTISYKPGFGGSGKFGYLVTPDIAIELEGAYRRNDEDKTVNAPGVTSTGTGKGGQTSSSAMANLVYTYHTQSLFSPYIGGGGGISHINAYRTFTSGSETIKAIDWTPGYQFFAGVAYDIRDTPLEVTFGYRFFTTQEITKNFTSVDDPIRFKSTIHSIELGGNLHF